jgi:hypothetical protein
MPTYRQRRLLPVQLGRTKTQGLRDSRLDALVTFSDAYAVTISTFRAIHQDRD